MTDSIHHRDVAQPPAPGWFGTLHAPVTFFIRPRATLRHVLHGPASALALAFILGIAVFTIVLMGDAVCIYAMTRSAAKSGHAQLSIAFEQLFDRGSTDGVVFFVLRVFATILIASLVGTAILLSDVHRAGPIRSSILRALRIVSCAPWMLAFFAIMTACITLPIEYCALAPGSLIPSLGPPAEAIGLFPSIVLSIAAFIVLSLRAARLAGDALPAPVKRPPLCEGCGYDLSHVSTGGVCTECGLPLAKSLELDAVRPGNRWESRRKPKEWLHSSRAVVFKSTVFYQTLKLRTSIDAATEYSRNHFVLMGIGGGIWILVLCVIASLESRPLGNSDYFIAVFLPFLGSVWVPCAGWVLHRMVFSIAFIAWMLTSSIPDARWLIKVREYETAFLWLFCAFNGTWISLVIVHPAWMKELLALYRSLNLPQLGLPLEIVGVFAGNAILIVAWMLRYRRIHQAIRWSNS